MPKRNTRRPSRRTVKDNVRMQNANRAASILDRGQERSNKLDQRIAGTFQRTPTSRVEQLSDFKRQGLINQRNLLERGVAAPLTAAGQQAVDGLNQTAQGGNVVRRSAPGTPLRPGSGAGGQQGSLGFNSSSLTRTSQGLFDRTEQRRQELEAGRNDPTVNTGFQLQDVVSNATNSRNSILEQSGTDEFKQEQLRLHFGEGFGELAPLVDSLTGIEARDLAKRFTDEFGRPIPEFTDILNQLKSIPAFKEVFDRVGGPNPFLAMSLALGEIGRTKSQIDNGQFITGEDQSFLDGLDQEARDAQSELSDLTRGQTDALSDQITEQGLNAEQSQVGSVASAQSAERTAITDSAIASLIASAPPEQVPYLKSLQGVINAKQGSIGAAGDLATGQEQFAFDSFNGQQGLIEQSFNDLNTEQNAIQGFLSSNKESSERSAERSREAQRERIAYEEMQAARKVNKQKRESIDSLTISIALQGGFGNTIAEGRIGKVEAEAESILSDLRMQSGFRRDDVEREFNGRMDKALASYQSGVLTAIQSYRSESGQLRQQSFSARETLRTRRSDILANFVDTVTTKQEEMAKEIERGTSVVSQSIKDEETAKVKREDVALERIEYLLDNYPRESVAEAIKELGKNVTSFDVQAIIDNPSLEELKRAKISMTSNRGGGSFSSSFLPFNMQTPEVPEKTYEEFLDDLPELQLSMEPSVKAEFLEENDERLREEYEATYGVTHSNVAGAREELTATFGEGAVIAAEQIMNGTFGGANPTKNAAKAHRVSEGSVATALNKLRSSGAIQDTKVLSNDANKKWKGIRKEITNDTFYSVWRGSQSAVTRIKVAIETGGGADGLSDIMAINAFQNGIVDPGATVREGDVVLLQTAIAWADQVNWEFWREKISNGDKLPQKMRERMLELANAVERGYGEDFRSISLPQLQSTMTTSGLPRSILDDFLGTGNTVNQGGIAVSPETSSFVDSLSF